MSEVLGIIGEYNPFHNGHLYHIAKSKEETGAQYVVCVISGNFVQRGDTSIINKWAKAKMALEGGADLVIELPTIYSISSAENFAEGAIKILNSLKIVDTISFGMEANDVSILNNIANVLYAEPKEYTTMLAHELQKGNLIIKKIDATSEKELSKAEFLVFNDNKIIYYGPTKENGILELKNLALGTYYIKEVKSPHGYVLDDNIYEIHLVENNKTKVVIIKNELKRGNLTIKKVDENTKKPLYNTEFIILKDNTIIYKGITNKDGILTIDNLTLGLYTIKEIKASNGYNINEEEISIIITDKENYIEITNERLIDKEDYIEIPNIPNTNVNGVEILLYYEDKNKMHKRDL